MNPIAPPTLFAPAPATNEQAWREVARIWVPGIPRPGGSKTARVIMRMGKVVMTSAGRPLVTMRDDAKGNAEWKQLVSFYAQQQYSGAPLDGTLKADFIFYMPRIGSHYGSGKNAGVLKANAPVYHEVRPDKTKLTRSTEDALSGVLWTDDARIADGGQKKLYACEASEWKPGAEIRISILDGGNLWQ
jgi:Holliday junction resolvase RusA-like endonuclease